MEGTGCTKAWRRGRMGLTPLWTCGSLTLGSVSNREVKGLNSTCITPTGQGRLNPITIFRTPS